MAKFLTSLEVQWYEASTRSYTPVRWSVFEKMRSTLVSERDAKRMSALEETITHYAITPPKFAEYPLIEDLMASGVQEAITGRQTPKEALLLMENKVQEVLS